VTSENVGLGAQVDRNDPLDANGEYIGWEYGPTESVDVD